MGGVPATAGSVVEVIPELVGLGAVGGDRVADHPKGDAGAVALAGEHSGEPTDRHGPLLGRIEHHPAQLAFDQLAGAGLLGVGVELLQRLTGHVVGVFIAHDRALADYTRPRQRLRAQYPLLVVMVTYTLGGIALLLGA